MYILIECIYILLNINVYINFKYFSLNVNILHWIQKWFNTNIFWSNAYTFIEYKCFQKYQIFFIECKYILLSIKFHFPHISATIHTSILGYVQLIEMRHFQNFLNLKKIVICFCTTKVLLLSLFYFTSVVVAN